MKKPKIIVSVTNDLTTDQRVNKICNELVELNYEVILVGRKLKHSQQINRRYKTKRFRLFFNKGFLFYANYNIRLFWFLLFSKPDTLWSNDLDTLLANFLVSRLKNKPLVFDSHEYFTEVPELINRPMIKRFWKNIERTILPQLTSVITVSPSIARLYQKEYNIKVDVLRNVPLFNKTRVKVESLKISGVKTIIYQGAININRGIEQMIKAMQFVENAKLYIIGEGDITKQINALVKSLNLSKKVKLMGQIPLENLHSYTLQADLGLSLEEDKGLNYRFALPNKLFDYIHAEVPVLVSDLPEMRTIVEQYQVGEIIENHTPEHIANKINEMLTSPTQQISWKTNAKKAAKELNWEKETIFLQEFLKAIK